MSSTYAFELRAVADGRRPRLYLVQVPVRTEVVPGTEDFITRWRLEGNTLRGVATAVSEIVARAIPTGRVRSVAKGRGSGDGREDREGGSRGETEAARGPAAVVEEDDAHNAAGRDHHASWTVEVLIEEDGTVELVEEVGIQLLLLAAVGTTERSVERLHQVGMAVAQLSAADLAYWGPRVLGSSEAWVRSAFLTFVQSMSLQGAATGPAAGGGALGSTSGAAAAGSGRGGRGRGGRRTSDDDARGAESSGSSGSGAATRPQEPRAAEPRTAEAQLSEGSASEGRLPATAAVSGRRGVEPEGASIGGRSAGEVPVPSGV